MPRQGTGWTALHTDVTVTRSAYCPVCCVRTVHIAGPYEPIMHTDIAGLERLQGCMTAVQLRCSEHCLQVYQGRVEHAMRGHWNQTAYVELGALSDAVAERLIPR